jgi:RNA:NAD 2'-phosphotransferase (TPT1/KptA family)
MKGPVEYEYAPILENVELVAEAEIEQLAGVGDSKNNLVKVSKGMSAVLRHDKKGKVLRPDGWALLEKLRVNEKDAMKAVLDNNKVTMWINQKSGLCVTVFA